MIIVENVNTIYFSAGLSSLGVPGVPWHTQILADQLILFQPEGTDYAHLITTGTPRFSDLPTALALPGQVELRKKGFSLIHGINFHYPQ